MSIRHKEFKIEHEGLQEAKACKRYVGLIRFHIRIVRIKKRRASGGCLGNERRRRTWYSAKIHGELRTSIDP